MFGCHAFLLLLAILCAALAIRVSGTSRRTSEAVARAGLLVLFLVVPAALCGLAYAVRDLPTLTIALVLAAALTALMLSKASEAVRGGDAAAAAHARLAGALVYLCLLLLAWLPPPGKGGDYLFRGAESILALHLWVVCLGCAVACACTQPFDTPAGCRWGALRSGQVAWAATIRYWAGLHIVGLAVAVLAAALDPVLPVFPQTSAAEYRIGLVWPMALVSGAFLLSTSFAFLLAMRLSSLPRLVRTAVSALPLAATLFALLWAVASDYWANAVDPRVWSYVRQSAGVAAGTGWVLTTRMAPHLVQRHTLFGLLAWVTRDPRAWGHLSLTGGRAFLLAAEVALSALFVSLALAGAQVRQPRTAADEEEGVAARST